MLRIAESMSHDANRPAVVSFLFFLDGPQSFLGYIKLITVSEFLLSFFTPYIVSPDILRKITVLKFTAIFAVVHYIEIQLKVF